MKVLIACEFSGVVREAFKAAGHDAWSCDLLPSEIPGQHYQCDVLDLLSGEAFDPLHPEPFDLMIAHPPCTHLAASGARWFDTKEVEQRKAIYFFMELAKANIPRIAIENPVGIMSSIWRQPDQIIQPWQFGHGEMKTTCLWLKGLPKLKPTCIVEGREQRIWKMPPSENRGYERSRTYPGIAKAMAEQWGKQSYDFTNINFAFQSILL